MLAVSSEGVRVNDSNGDLTFLQSNDTYQPGQWYHVAGVYDGQEMRLYVDGQLQASSNVQSGDIYYPSATEFVIGAYKDSDEFYPLSGQMDEVRLWNRVRTAEEINRDQRSRLQGNEYGLVGYWRLDELTGTTVKDA